jgi:hypothetical protein
MYADASSSRWRSPGTLHRAGASNDLLVRLRLEAHACQVAERSPTFGRMLEAANGELRATRSA